MQYLAYSYGRVKSHGAVLEKKTTTKPIYRPLRFTGNFLAEAHTENNFAGDGHVPMRNIDDVNAYGIDLSFSESK